MQQLGRRSRAECPVHVRDPTWTLDKLEVMKKFLKVIVLLTALGQTVAIAEKTSPYNCTDYVGPHLDPAEQPGEGQNPPKVFMNCIEPIGTQP